MTRTPRLKAAYRRARALAGKLRDLKYLEPRATGRQVAALRKCFRDRVTIARAEDEIRWALDHREQRFLEVARTLIYGRPESPYLILLNNAGCTFADLQRHVRGHGLEATLARLAQEGVYLTANEFKGKSDVVRGAKVFRVSRADFARPDTAPGLMVQSSGTSNAPQTGHVALDWLSIWTPSKGIFLSAHDLLSNSHAVYGDLYELMEKTLPSEFGGDPGHYQLVEEEDEHGQTRLTLLVDPVVGGLDEEKLSSRIREEFLRGPLGYDAVARAWWYHGGTFRVRRESPRASSRGKILPLQIPR